MKHAVVIGVVAGITAVLVLVLVSLVLVVFSVGGSRHHVVELGPDGEPTYTVP